MSAKVGIICGGIINKDFKQDPVGTLEKIAELGLEGIEIGRNFEKPDFVIDDDKFRMLVNKLGLEIICVHVLLKDLTDYIDDIISYCRIMDIKFVDLVWTPCDSIKWLYDNAPVIDKAGEKLRMNGIQLTYHNHDHEFNNVFEGRKAIDILYSLTSKENLMAEVDVAWVTFGKEDPANFIKRYKGRCPLLHFKDLIDPNIRDSFIEIGSGMVDFKKIAEEANKNGARWFVIEQDKPHILEGFESVKRSVEYLKSIGIMR